MARPRKRRACPRPKGHLALLQPQGAPLAALLAFAQRQGVGCRNEHEDTGLNQKTPKDHLYHVPCISYFTWVNCLGECLRSVNSDGTLSVSGGKDLKTSQHYPILFGRTVAEVVMQNHESIYNNVYKRRRGLQSYPSTKNPSTTFNGYPVLDVL